MQYKYHDIIYIKIIHYSVCVCVCVCVYTWRAWQPTPVFLPGESHGQRSLIGYSPWGCKESDTTELLHFDFSLSCIGEGNGNPLQCSYLENPRDSPGEMGETGVLLSVRPMGSHRVGHDWSDAAAAAACFIVCELPIYNLCPFFNSVPKFLMYIYRNYLNILDIKLLLVFHIVGIYLNKSA